MNGIMTFLTYAYFFLGAYALMYGVLVLMGVL